MTVPYRIRCKKAKQLANDVGEAMVGFYAEARELFPNCLSCKHYHEISWQCMKYGGIPPPRIIVNGCKGYEDVDDIPF